jgi:hypothetical protein
MEPGAVSRNQAAVAELELALASARDRVTRAGAALGPENHGSDVEEWNAAVADQLRLERELSLARGEETAVLVDWQPRWDAGAPLPHVMSSAHRTVLVYLISEPDPSWDGTTVNVVDPTSPEERSLALVEFTRCYAHRFAGVSNDVLHGHPLAGKGLTAYSAHQVANSRWLAAETQIHSVDGNHDPVPWGRLRHYLLMFHDDLFECLAEGVDMRVARCSFRQGIDLALKRLFED